MKKIMMLVAIFGGVTFSATAQEFKYSEKVKKDGSRQVEMKVEEDGTTAGDAEYKYESKEKDDKVLIETKYSEKNELGESYDHKSEEKIVPGDKYKSEEKFEQSTFLGTKIEGKSETKVEDGEGVKSEAKVETKPLDGEQVRTKAEYRSVEGEENGAITYE